MLLNSPAESFSRPHEALLICCNCRSLPDSPFCRNRLLLACLHSVCSQCIGNLGSNCPACGCPDAKDYLCENFFAQLLQPPTATASGCGAKRNDCVCTNCGENKLAASACFRCFDLLCGPCGDDHRRVRMTKDHNLTDINQVSDAQIISLCHRNLRITCPRHSKNEVKFYCHSCCILTCSDCQLIDHKDHKYLPLEEISHGFENFVSHVAVPKLQSCRGNLVARSADIQQQISEVETQRGVLTNEVDRLIAQLHARHLMVVVAAGVATENGFKSLESKIKRQLRLKSSDPSLLDYRGKVLRKDITDVCNARIELLNVQNSNVAGVQAVHQQINHLLSAVTSVRANSNTKALASLKINAAFEKCEKFWENIPATLSPVDLSIDGSLMNMLPAMLAKFGQIMVCKQVYASPYMAPEHLANGFQQVAATGVQPARITTARHAPSLDSALPCHGIASAPMSGRSVSAANKNPTPQDGPRVNPSSPQFVATSANLPQASNTIHHEPCHRNSSQPHLSSVGVLTPTTPQATAVVFPQRQSAPSAPATSAVSASPSGSVGVGPVSQRFQRGHGDDSRLTPVSTSRSQRSAPAAIRPSCEPAPAQVTWSFTRHIVEAPFSFANLNSSIPIEKTTAGKSPETRFCADSNLANSNVQATDNSSASNTPTSQVVQSPTLCSSADEKHLRSNCASAAISLTATSVKQLPGSIPFPSSASGSRPFDNSVVASTAVVTPTTTAMMQQRALASETARLPEQRSEASRKSIGSTEMLLSILEIDSIGPAYNSDAADGTDSESTMPSSSNSGANQEKSSGQPEKQPSVDLQDESAEVQITAASSLSVPPISCVVCKVGREDAKLLQCRNCLKHFHAACYVTSDIANESNFVCLLCTNLCSLKSDYDCLWEDMGEKKPANKLTEYERKVCQRILLELCLVNDCSWYFEPQSIVSSDVSRVSAPKCAGFHALRDRLTEAASKRYDSISSIDSFMDGLNALLKRAAVLTGDAQQPDRVELLHAGRQISQKYKQLIDGIIPLYSDLICLPSEFVQSTANDQCELSATSVAAFSTAPSTLTRSSLKRGSPPADESSILVTSIQNGASDDVNCNSVSNKKAKTVNVCDAS